MLLVGVRPPELLWDPPARSRWAGVNPNKTREKGNSSGFGSDQEQPPILPKEQEVQINPLLHTAPQYPEKWNREVRLIFN